MEYTTSVRKSERGWEAFMRFKDAEGKQRQRRKVLGADIRTKRAALAEAGVWAVGIAEAIDSQTPEGCQTLESYMSAWLKMLERVGKIEPSTATSYRGVIKTVSMSDLANVRICDLTTKQVQQFIAKYAETHKAATTIRTLTVISESLRHAEEVGDIPSNPCKHVHSPKKQQTKPNALTPAAAGDLMRALETMNPTEAPTAALIALHTGMRVGEICALKWSDIDPQRRIIHVRRSICVQRPSSLSIPHYVDK